MSATLPILARNHNHCCHVVGQKSRQCFDQKQRFRLEVSGPADHSRNLAVCLHYLFTNNCEVTTGKVWTSSVLSIYVPEMACHGVHPVS